MFLKQLFGPRTKTGPKFLSHHNKVLSQPAASCSHSSSPAHQRMCKVRCRGHDFNSLFDNYRQKKIYRFQWRMLTLVHSLMHSDTPHALQNIQLNVSKTCRGSQFQHHIPDNTVFERASQPRSFAYGRSKNPPLFLN